MRGQALSAQPASRPAPRPSADDAEAGARLLSAYAALAGRGEHLFGRLMKGEAPRQWEHYPADDALCRSGGYQWFYHSHSPEDRAGDVEHGHIHLFARRPLWGRRRHSGAERAFAKFCGGPASDANTRHLLAIGFEPKGLPVSLFTVNSWVTGDRMLGAALTLDLLSRMQLDTGYPEIDAVIESTVRLCMPEIAGLMSERDRALAAHAGAGTLGDTSLEVLSEVAVDLDAKLMTRRV